MMDTAAVRATGESVDVLGKRLQKTDSLLSPLPTGPKRPLPKGPFAEKQDAPNSSPFGPTLERSNSGLSKPRPQGSNNVGQRAAFFEAQIKAEDQAKTHDAVAAKLNRFRSLPTTIRIPRDEPRGRQISARESYEQHIREKMRQSMPPILQARYFGAIRGKHNRTSSSTKPPSPEPSPSAGITVVTSFPGTATRAASYSVSTPSPTPSPRSSSSSFSMPALTSVGNRSFPSSLASSSNASSFRSSYSSPLTSFPPSSSSFPSSSTPSSSFPSTPTASFPSSSSSSSFGGNSSFPNSSSFPSTSSCSVSFPSTPASSSFPSSSFNSASSFTSSSLFPSLKPINAVPLSPPARSLPPLIPHAVAPPSAEVQSPSRRVRPMARTWGLAAENKTGTAPPATNPEVFKDLMASKYRQSEGDHANKEVNDEKQPTLIPASPIIVDKSPLKEDQKGSGNSKTSSFPPPIPELQVTSTDAGEVDRSVWDDDVVVVSPEPGSADKINVWDIDDVCVVENPSPAAKEPSLLDKIKSVSMSEEAMRFAEYALLDFVVVRLPETKTVKGILRAPAEKRGGRSIEFDLKQSEMPNCMYEQEEFEREEEEARKRQEEEEEEDSGSPLDDDEAEPVPQFLIDDGDDDDEGDGSGEEEDDPLAKKKPDINPLDAWKRAMEEKTLKLRELNESPSVPVASTPTGNLRTFRVAPRSWGGTTKTEDVPSDPSPSVTSYVSDNPLSSSLTADVSSFPSMSETKDNDGDSSEEDASEPSLTASIETKQQRLARIKSKKKFMLDRAKSGGTITKGFGKNSVKMPDLTVTGESALEAWKRAMEDKTQKMKAIQAARVASSPTASTTTLGLAPSSTPQDNASSDVVVTDTSVADASPTAAESGKRAFRVQPRPWKSTTAASSENASSDGPASTSTPTPEATKTASEDTFDAFSAWTKAMEEKAQKMKVATSSRVPPGPPSTPQGESATDEASDRRKRPVTRPWATASPSFFTNAMTENAASTSANTSTVPESSVEEPATPTEPKTPTRRMPRVQPRAWAGAAAAVLAEHKEEKESGVNNEVVANFSQSSSQGEKSQKKAESEDVTIDPLAEPITPRRMRAKVQPRNWGTASASALAQAQAQPVSSET